MKGSHVRRSELPFVWPTPAVRIALVEPQIPPNTGNIARLCAATGCSLHLVEPLGFDISDRAVKRAGLDYWDSVDLSTHPSFNNLLKTLDPPRFFLFSTAAKTSFYDQTFAAGDMLVFGSETSGLADEILDTWPERVVGIPIRPDHVRSLNLASSVAIAAYEALRQINSNHQSS